MKIPVYTQDGSKTKEIDAPKEIFGHPARQSLIHKMLLIQLSNRRHSIAHTLTKGEVRGGGIKPYRQKHTGRARQGSTRNPHFRGGGVAFGPRSTRNFQLRITTGEKRQALFSALSSKQKVGAIAVLEGFETTTPKTKQFATMLSKLPFQKKILFVLPGKNEPFVKSSRNLEKVDSLMVNYLNIADVVGHSTIVFVQDALDKFKSVFKPTI